MDIESLLNEEGSTRDRAETSEGQPVEDSERKPSVQYRHDSITSLSSARSALAFSPPHPRSAYGDRYPQGGPEGAEEPGPSGMTMAPRNENEVPPKTLPCARCDKKFARRSDLVRHERIHTGVRPHACTYAGCDKTFIQRSALTVHERTHTGQKPHECSDCGKPFSDSSSLARHRRTHTGARPYVCEFAGCGKQFTRKTTLTRHRQGHSRKGHIPVGGEGSGRRDSETGSSDRSQEDVDAEGSVSAASAHPREPPSASSMYSTFSLRNPEQSPSQHYQHDRGYQRQSFSSAEHPPAQAQMQQPPYAGQGHSYPDQKPPAGYAYPPPQPQEPQARPGYEQYAPPPASSQPYYPPPPGDRRDSSGATPYPNPAYQQWRPPAR